MGTVPTMINTALAKRRRAELGLTLAQVAQRVGVFTQSVQQWEKGTYDPVNLPTLKAYADALEVSVEDLLAEPEPEVAATP